MSGAIETANAHWDPVPDWIAALAEACARSSQSQVAKRLERSPSLVSTVLKGTYRGDMHAVEERVRGVLMAATVECPALGAIPTQACQDWQAKATRFAPGNPMRVQMARACKRCPRYLRGRQP